MGRLWKSGCQQYFPFDMGTFPAAGHYPPFVRDIQISRSVCSDLSIQICSPVGFSFVNPWHRWPSGGCRQWVGVNAAKCFPTNQLSYADMYFVLFFYVYFHLNFQ